MNYINKTIILTVSSFLIGGCVTKTEVVNEDLVVKSESSKSHGWGAKTLLKSSPEQACVNCYTPPLPEQKVATVSHKKFESMDYSKESSSEFASLSSINKEKVATVDTYSYGAYDYGVTPDDTYIEEESVVTMKHLTPKLSYINSSQDEYGKKTAIQIGAFRRYAGAKSYAKKYALLSDKYHVEIKTGLKDKKPIHRVRIEGFSSRAEAKRFINRYGIDDAFFVRR